MIVMPSSLLWLFRLSVSHCFPSACWWSLCRRGCAKRLVAASGFLRSGSGAGEVSRAGTVHESKTTIIGVRICSEGPSPFALPAWCCARLVGLAVHSESKWPEASRDPETAAARCPQVMTSAAGNGPRNRPRSGNGAGEVARELGSRRAGTVHEFQDGHHRCLDLW